jgi:arylsulfatase A-like enzyme
MKLAALLILIFTAFSHGAPKPNVLFILADDLGWNDVSLYGSQFYETPNIDALAERGMKFNQAYAASPLCSPTRASILSGLFPARIGITAPHALPLLAYRSLGSFLSNPSFFSFGQMTARL